MKASWTRSSTGDSRGTSAPTKTRKDAFRLPMTSRNASRSPARKRRTASSRAAALSDDFPAASAPKGDPFKRSQRTRRLHETLGQRADTQENREGSRGKRRFLVGVLPAYPSSGGNAQKTPPGRQV